MPTDEEKVKIQKQITEKKKDISDIQTILNSINEKESAFAEKNKFSQKISVLITDIKQLRTKRNSLTQHVRKDKRERDKYNNEVKSSVKKIKELEKTRDEILKKSSVKDPSGIIKQMAALETKIETEPMSFEAEKKIMKKIKELKKQATSALAANDTIKEISTLSKHIDEKKKSAQERHKVVQDQAQESQSQHEKLLTSSKEIEDLKAKEEKYFKEFIDHKKEFNEVNEQLKVKLDALKPLLDLMNDDRVEKKKQHEKKKEKELMAKKVSVEEKIKKRMKLTTEDLLAFQSTQED